MGRTLERETNRQYRQTSRDNAEYAEKPRRVRGSMSEKNHKQSSLIFHPNFDWCGDRRFCSSVAAELEPGHGQWGAFLDWYKCFFPS